MTLVDSQTSSSTSTGSPSSQAVTPLSLTLTNPDSGYEVALSALTLIPRPTFPANNDTVTTPPQPRGLRSPGVVIKLTTATGLQTGATISISPPDGITQRSLRRRLPRRPHA